MSNFGIDAAQTNREAIIDQKPNYPALLQQFLNTHWRQTLVVWQAGIGDDPVEPQMKPTADTLYVRIEKRDKMAYIDRHYLRSWCTQNHVIFNEMEKFLDRERVVIDRGFNKNLGQGTPWSAGGYIRTWRVKLDHRLMGHLQLMEGASRPNTQHNHEIDLELDRDAREFLS